MPTEGIFLVEILGQQVPLQVDPLHLVPTINADAILQHATTPLQRGLAQIPQIHLHTQPVR